MDAEYIAKHREAQKRLSDLEEVRPSRMSSVCIVRHRVMSSHYLVGSSARHPPDLTLPHLTSPHYFGSRLELPLSSAEIWVRSSSMSFQTLCERELEG